MSCDLHRHDEFSSYDGSGKASELAQIAKEKGLTSLGLSNHGNTSGNILHYDACKEAGIKPIMGVEAYFLPTYKEKSRGYHLCLFAASVEGYRNMNIIQSLGDAHKYYNPIITFDDLEKHSDGIICTSACVASFTSQCIINDNIKMAVKAARRFKSIFGDNFYFEIQPYVISDPGIQEKVNLELLKLSDKLGIECILTSDSHRGREEDLEAYVKMHQLKNNTPEHIDHIRKTYAERYMPDAGEMEQRFIEMHKGDIGLANAKAWANRMHDAMEALEDKVDPDIIDKITELPAIPVFDETKDSYKLLVSNVKSGLKERGVWNKKYIARAKEELAVIKANDFQDYFLIVQDYVMWARNNGIGVGPGRGSGCNCLVNYALGITDSDPIRFDLDFRRFIREDKKTLPDIDVDFETSRRSEVQDYLLKKWAGHACQIASYGLYKIDNLVNDLVKIYDNLVGDKATIKEIKRLVNRYRNEEEQVDVDALRSDPAAKVINRDYPLFFDAFAFMYNKVKFLGTHAAGVAITREDIHYYTATRTTKGEDRLYSYHNLVDLERCGVVKYDLLGLSTLSSLVEMRKVCGVDGFDVSVVDDEDTIQAFGQGKSNGVFQYSSRTAQNILQEIHTDCFNDVVAASAMNRPGPLSQGIPEQYANAKLDYHEPNVPWSKYLNDTYGCILYQEQVNAIAVEFGSLSWNQADKLRKMDDPRSLKSRLLLEENYQPFLKQFREGMARYGLDDNEAKQLFDKFLNYSFNKGHAVGYALISQEEMWFKVHHPMVFWYVKLKQADMDGDGRRFIKECAADGNIIFTSHVNYSKPDFSLRKIEGEPVIQHGLVSVKGCGMKAAIEIYNERKKNGLFRSYDDFYDRCKSRVVNARVLRVLEEAGALEFDKKRYIEQVTRYNTNLLLSSEG